jgi:hypothetical protein
MDETIKSQVLQVRNSALTNMFDVAAVISIEIISGLTSLPPIWQQATRVNTRDSSSPARLDYTKRPTNNEALRGLFYCPDGHLAREGYRLVFKVFITAYVSTYYADNSLY